MAAATPDELLAEAVTIANTAIAARQPAVTAVAQHFGIAYRAAHHRLQRAVEQGHTLNEPPAPDRSWVEHGACRGVDPDLFFPDKHENATYAKRVCAVCVVRSACLDYALDNGEIFGVWGGTSDRERRRLRRDRRHLAVAS